jgi:hypothetical protein
LASILVPSANVRFGPGFGLTKPRYDVNVLQLFKDKLARMISDLEFVQRIEHVGSSEAIIGDTRKLRACTNEKIFDYVITSPPYPGDHDYTRHTRLELSFLDFFSARAKGIATFLVGDSHAFKMVHIETARLLGEIGKDVGFSAYDIELWWNKRSTSHNFLLPEYILHLKK